MTTSGTNETVTKTEAMATATPAEVDAQIARLDRLDWGAMTPRENASLAALRQKYLAIRASLPDEALAAELQAGEYAGRDLAPDELAAIRKRH
jgi:hypothetical protein